MRKARRAAIVAILLVLVAGVLIYSVRGSGSPPAIVGVVRATEVRVEPEVNGQLVSIAVEKGAHVRAGDVLAKLSAVELTAQADQARAALASATANRNNVYAGVRREQVDSLKAAIAKANSRLDYVQAQFTRTSTLARQNFESQQSLDQAENDVASARAGVVEAQANYDAAVAGPTKEEMAVFPTRAVLLPDGRTAYTFTMFQGPDMPDELFEAQRESLRREFANIEKRFS